MKTAMLSVLLVLHSSFAAWASMSDAQAMRQIKILLAEPESKAGQAAGLKVILFAAKSTKYYVDISQAYLPWVKERSLPQGSQVLTAAFIAGNIREQIRKQSSSPEPYAGVQAALRVYEKMRSSDSSFRIEQAERFLELERSGSLRKMVDSSR